jgi:hypothetical protein
MCTPSPQVPRGHIHTHDTCDSYGTHDTSNTPTQFALARFFTFLVLLATQGGGSDTVPAPVQSVPATHILPAALLRRLPARAAARARSRVPARVLVRAYGLGGPNARGMLDIPSLTRRPLLCVPPREQAHARAATKALSGTQLASTLLRRRWWAVGRPIDGLVIGE